MLLAEPSPPVAAPLSFTPNPWRYERRKSREVMVGKVGVGGANPIRVQSMLTCDTMDTAACVRQTLELVEVGCEIVRITAPTVRDAANLEHIKAALLERGCDVPLVADIHFKPDAALEAARWVEKVRVNPGNFADSKKFNVREYSREQYQAELDRIAERFTPLVRLCQQRGVSMRIGTNHGSLSDRIMNQFGDSPLGMVESALEYVRVARALGYHDLIFSMKASNPKVMVAAYRLLVARLAALGPDWNYPIHLGVTEAGDGEDGRTKSAAGIGSLLADGIGDTVRVSLTEDSIHEIPVAQALVAPFNAGQVPDSGLPADRALPFDPFQYRRRASHRVVVQGYALGGEEVPRVVVPRADFEAVAHKLARLGDFQPEIIREEAHAQAQLFEVDPRDDAAIASLNQRPDAALVTVRDGLKGLPVVTAFRLLAAKLDARHPILLKDTLHPAAGEVNRGTGTEGESVAKETAAQPSASGALTHDSRFTIHDSPPPDFLRALLDAAANLGSLLCDGIGDAVLVQGWAAPGQSLRLAYNTLQAAGARIFKTDYVACPSCGRTLFDLQSTTARIRAATGHLKGVKIAIMGCIVNGPGEMADADFGYVGGAPGKINLYVGKKPVKFNIPSDEAVARLQDLIREHGKWVDAPASQEAAVLA